MGSTGLESTVEQRKKWRMKSNRESARRSRMKKQQHLDELVKEVGSLEEENRRITARANGCACPAAGLERENAELRRRLEELALRLRQLKRVLRAVQELSGEAMDIVEVPNPQLSGEAVAAALRFSAYRRVFSSIAAVRNLRVLSLSSSV
ncbi:bZIP transcription factor 53-like [Wolffia australiana]